MKCIAVPNLTSLTILQVLIDMSQHLSGLHKASAQSILELVIACSGLNLKDASKQFELTAVLPLAETFKRMITKARSVEGCLFLHL